MRRKSTGSLDALNRIRSQIATLNVSSLGELAQSLANAGTPFETIGDDEVTEAANELLNEVVETEDFRRATLEGKIDQLLDFAKRQPTNLQSAFANVAYNLVASLLWLLICSAVTTFVLPEAPQQERQSVNIAITLVEELEFSEEFIDDTRIVKRESGIAVAPGKKKRQVAVLSAGTVVYALRKHGKWVEIE